jgi:hypothetical protein
VQIRRLKTSIEDQANDENQGQAFRSAPEATSRMTELVVGLSGREVRMTGGQHEIYIVRFIKIIKEM